jgi:hypothetical protein
VTPPLEFRHLQVADLSSWQGDTADPQFTGLRTAVTAMAGRTETPGGAPKAAVAPAQRWWQTLPGQALGVGGLLIGLSTLLIALKQVGLIGAPSHLQAGTGAPASQSPPVVSPAEHGAQTPSSAVVDKPPPVAVAISLSEPLNLLDTEAGARLLAANEESWKRLFGGNLTSTIVSRHGFAVLAVRGNKAAKFDTLGVFVDYASTDNIKDLALFASSESAEGPFVMIAQLTVPNYRNMEKPLHELRFAPTEARFVNVQVLSLRNDYGPNGLLGTIQLYASKP